MPLGASPLLASGRPSNIGLSVVPEIALLTCLSLYSPGRGTVRVFLRSSGSTPPFADDFLRHGQSESLHPQSHFVTCRRSPEVSSTAFNAQPPGLTTSALHAYALPIHRFASPSP